MITHLEISHYKSISKLNLELNDLNICIGKNASGKSNFLDAIAFLTDIAQDGFDTAISKRHGVTSVCQWSKTKPYDTTIAAKFKHKRLGEGSYRITFSSKNEDYIIKSEAGLWFYDGKDHHGNDVKETYSFARNHEGKVLINAPESSYLSSRPEVKVDLQDTFLNRLGATRGFYGRLSMLANVLSSSKLYRIYPNIIRQPELPTSSTELKEDGSNICRIFKMLSRDSRMYKSRKQKVLDGLRCAMPQLSHISIRRLGEWYVPWFFIFSDSSRKKTHKFNTSQLSDGTLRMFALLVALYQPRPPDIISIEEPEQNINPALLSILSESIADVSDNTQIFLSTHSPAMLDKFPVESFLVFDYFEGVTKVGNIEKEQIDIVKSGLMSLGEISMTDEIRIDPQCG